MKCVSILILIFASAFVARSQCPTMPEGTICLTQAQANVAAQNARELAATKEKVTLLESAMLDKDKSVAEVKAAGDKNAADLKAALHKTEVELASKTGQLIGSEANNVRNLALIDVLLKSVKKKCIVSIICL